jgi:hypothetical protein
MTGSLERDGNYFMVRNRQIHRDTATKKKKRKGSRDEERRPVYEGQRNEAPRRATIDVNRHSTMLSAAPSLIVCILGCGKSHASLEWWTRGRGRGRKRRLVIDSLTYG